MTNCCIKFQNNTDISSQKVMVNRRPVSFRINTTGVSMWIREPEKDADIIDIDIHELIREILDGYKFFLKNNPDFQIEFKGLLF